MGTLSPPCFEKEGNSSRSYFFPNLWNYIRDPITDGTARIIFWLQFSLPPNAAAGRERKMINLSHDLSPRQSKCTRRPFEGRSTDWATAPQQAFLVNLYVATVRLFVRPQTWLGWPGNALDIGLTLALVLALCSFVGRCGNRSGRWFPKALTGSSRTSSDLTRTRTPCATPSSWSRLSRLDYLIIFLLYLFNRCLLNWLIGHTPKNLYGNGS